MSENTTPDPEKLSRERALLLTAFEPSASECTINQVFTEPGPGAAQLTDDPERMAAWVEEQEERLREATGFDLTDGPADSEEKTG